MKKRVLSLIIALITVISVTVIPAFAITTKEAEEKAMRLIELIIYGEMYATDDNGGGTVQAMYPALVEAIKKDPSLYDKLLESYLENSDEYTYFMTPEEFQQTLYGTESVSIGVKIENEDDSIGLTIFSVVTGSPAEAAGLHKGDKIVTVEGVDVSKLPVLEALEKLGLYATQEGKTFTVGVIHTDGTAEDIKLTPAKVNTAESNVTYEVKKSADGTEVGYIKIERFLAETHIDYIAALEEFEKKGIKNVVIDLRDNYGGETSTTYEMLNATIPANLPMYYTIEKDYIGISTSDNITDYAPDIAILQNKDTASTAETFAAVLQYHKVAAIVGENSYGKTDAQIVLELSDGSYIAFTADTIKLPNGKNWAKTGITPDIKAVDDPATADIDEVFEAAVKALDGKPEALKEPATFDFYLNCIDEESTIDANNVVFVADPMWGKEVRYIFRSPNGILLTMNTREAHASYNSYWYTAFFDTAKYKAALTKAGYTDFDVLGTYQEDYGFDAKITVKTDVDAKYFYYWDPDNGTYEAFDGKPVYTNGTLTFTTAKGGLIIISEKALKQPR
ncbi:MAG: PDZ domain-containing protein [Ruminococcus sp.]|jgi:carboxyl-terminal processing protease|nr:PDZ domain-containing protein [Ruminococcus sp.]